MYLLKYFIPFDTDRQGTGSSDSRFPNSTAGRIVIFRIFVGENAFLLVSFLKIW